MRAIKPLRLAVLPRCYENDRRCHMAVSIAFYFPFEPSDVLLPEMSMWNLIAEEMGTAMPVDEGMPKPHPEVLVFGSAFPAGGEPKPVVKARLQLGSVDKSLYVIGDRIWDRAGAATDPKPFTSMPLDWTRAFGGEGFDHNPDGRGATSVVEGDTSYIPLPNIEHPKHLVESPKDRPEPASFGSIPLQWPQRIKKAGTYDKQWLEELFPGYARDMDWTFFNVAPPDQWLDGELRGDEPFVLENLHPEHPRIESRLPGVRARCFVNQRTSEGMFFREIDCRIDTVMLFPHRRRGVVYWRGVVDVLEDDGADVEQIVAAAEALDEARPRSHYERAMHERTDEKTRHLYTLKESDLVPAHWMRKVGLVDEKLTDMEDLLAREGLLEANMRVRAEEQLEAVREDLRARGIDPEEAGVPAELPPAEKPPSLEEMPEFHEKMTTEFEALKAQAEKDRDASIAQARADCEKAGLDFDEAVANAERDAAGPPNFSADGEIENLRERVVLSERAGVELTQVRELLADPELEDKLQRLEAMLFDGYRKHAHLQPAVEPRNRAASEKLRANLVKERAAGRSLKGIDLTGADLSELDLRGVDLREALLEATNLTGSDLSGADLSGACLVRARFEGASLAKAKVVDANLGAAVLGGIASVDGADMTGVNLYGADLRGADLSGARLGGATLLEAKLGETKLDRIVAEKLIFMKVDLPGTSFVEASINKSVFLECDLAGSDFTGARLQEAAFVEADASGCSFRDADITNLRAVKNTSFADSVFAGATADSSNFRGCDLRRCDFTGVSMNQSDFSEVDARDARLDGVSALGTLFIRSDLRQASLTQSNMMDALLQKAKIRGADFTGANLFRADFARIDGDEATTFKGANMKYIRFVRR